MKPSGARLFRTETKEMKHNNNQNMNAQIIQIIEEAKEPRFERNEKEYEYKYQRHTEPRAFNREQTN